MGNLTHGRPDTLQQAIIYFADADRCNEFMIELRWPDGQVRCPHCDSTRVIYLAAAAWKCYEKHPRREVLAQGRNDL